MNYKAYGNELYHHGILGQKWGVRRYQNPDGSLTPAGRERYGYGNGNSGKSGSKTTNETNSSSGIKGLTDEQKKALKVGATVVGAALAAYGVYKLSNSEMAKKFVNIGEEYVNKSIANNGENLNFLMDDNKAAEELLKSGKTKDEVEADAFNQLFSQITPNFNTNDVRSKTIRADDKLWDKVFENFDFDGDSETKKKGFIGDDDYILRRAFNAMVD